MDFSSSSASSTASTAVVFVPPPPPPGQFGNLLDPAPPAAAIYLPATKAAAAGPATPIPIKRFRRRCSVSITHAPAASLHDRFLWRSSPGPAGPFTSPHPAWLAHRIHVLSTHLARTTPIASYDTWLHALTPLPYIVLWFLLSLTLSVYNKTLFGGSALNFQYPLMTTAVHMCVQFACAAAALRWVRPDWRPKRLPEPRDYFARIVPCGVATGLDIGLSNASLETISLSFYTMVKSSSPMFVLLFAFLFGLETPTWRLSATILTICAGVALMVYDTPSFDVKGFLLVQTATVLSGFRWSVTQLLLLGRTSGGGGGSTGGHGSHGGASAATANPLATTYFLAPVMAVTLGALAALTEDGVWRSPYFATARSTAVILAAMLAGGVLAFMMLMAEFVLIGLTSVVTFSVAGIVKEVLTIVVSALVFGDRPFSALKSVGLVVSIAGIASYNLQRLRADSGGGGGGGADGGGHAPLPTEDAGGGGELGLLAFESDIDDDDEDDDGDDDASSGVDTGEDVGRPTILSKADLGPVSAASFWSSFGCPSGAQFVLRAVEVVEERRTGFGVDPWSIGRLLLETWLFIVERLGLKQEVEVEVDAQMALHSTMENSARGAKPTGFTWRCLLSSYAQESGPLNNCDLPDPTTAEVQTMEKIAIMLRECCEKLKSPKFFIWQVRPFGGTD
ncbi:triose-phosphate transporter family-domain-containing protein [Zopfochytrium polystomum]|nr:triose-phosphate transporter family-domain-containing protein [Zopfochytrium polystomum]